MSESPFEMHVVAIILSLDEVLQFDVAGVAKAGIDDYEYSYVEDITVEEVVRLMAYSKFLQLDDVPLDIPLLEDLRMDIATCTAGFMVNIAWIT